MSNLIEITGFESGAVVYHQERVKPTVVCCNWSLINGLPRKLTTGLIGLGEEMEDLAPVNPADVDLKILGLALEAAEAEVAADGGKSPVKIAGAWQGADYSVFTFKGWN